MRTMKIPCALAALFLIAPVASTEGRAQGCAQGCAQDSTAVAPQATEAPNEAEKVNPYTGNEEVVAEGRKLYLKYNCYGCHGAQGGGGMGRSLIDTEWAYGGDDRSVFETVRKGRPGGMPPFESLMTEDETWKVIAFVRSLYKGDSAAIVW